MRISFFENFDVLGSILYSWRFAPPCEASQQMLPISHCGHLVPMTLSTMLMVSNVKSDTVLFFFFCSLVCVFTQTSHIHKHALEEGRNQNDWVVCLCSEWVMINNKNTRALENCIYIRFIFLFHFSTICSAINFAQLIASFFFLESSSALCSLHQAQQCSHLINQPSTFLKAARLQAWNYLHAVPHYEPLAAVFIFLMGRGYF